jgi:hypothetical protein
MQPPVNNTDHRFFSLGPKFFLTAFLVFSLTQPSFAQNNPQCKPTWEQTLGAAKKKGRVVVWGPQGEVIREALTREFKKAFPNIAIEYSCARSGEQATRTKAERDGGVYSVAVLLN